MCGIAGIIQSFTANNKNEAWSIQHVKSMMDALGHRGPDGEGLWSNPKANALLGHRRLAIIDLTSTGAQPMHYLKRYTIVHNGEIYNYPELKETLQKAGYKFRSFSDTEVILAAYDLHKERCLQLFDGMFSFAIWDEKEQVLFAARDRFGEKPFYYHEAGGQFIFASEMKALWAAGIEKKPEEKMLLNYLTLGYVQNASDNELTFYKDIYSLPPAHYLIYRPGMKASVLHKYWKLDKEAKIQISPATAIEKFKQLLLTSVTRRMRSDVPVGSSLSGGLDSSSIIAMTEQLNPSGSNSTFSAVFPGFEKDESPFIQEVTNRYGLKNFTVNPAPSQLLDDFEKLCYHQEEPFSSSSIYAQYKVFELAAGRQVKVLLDGQGADETLAGYHKYIHWYLQELISHNKFSRAKKERLAFEKNGIHIPWGVKNYIAALMPGHAAILLEKKEYHKTISHPFIDHDFLKYARGKEWEGIHKPIVTKLNDILNFNCMENGLEELLRFADRNSMAHGVEVRLPFLNHELVQFVFSLPSKYKIHDGWTKWILRKTMEPVLPEKIVWRKDKTGYEPPQKQWMQDPMMQDRMHEAKKKLVANKILNPKILDKKPEPRAAHDPDNFDWRYLSAAGTLF